MSMLCLLLFSRLRMYCTSIPVFSSNTAGGYDDVLHCEAVYVVNGASCFGGYTPVTTPSLAEGSCCCYRLRCRRITRYYYTIRGHIVGGVMTDSGSFFAIFIARWGSTHSLRSSISSVELKAILALGSFCSMHIRAVPSVL